MNPEYDVIAVIRDPKIKKPKTYSFWFVLTIAFVFFALGQGAQLFGFCYGG